MPSGRCCVIKQLKSVTPPQSVPLTRPPTAQGSGQKGILIGSLMAGGLIGASVIIGLSLTKSPQPVAEPPASSSVSSPSQDKKLVGQASCLPNICGRQDACPTIRCLLHSIYIGIWNADLH